MLKTLRLENYRNHKQFELDLAEVTVLIGPNGTGKTNLLESIVMLSFCRSFREEDKKNLIHQDADFAKITGDDLEIILAKKPRLMMRAKERGVPRKISDFIGLLPSVVFSPETMMIITGPPAERRRFLDVMISQIDKEYLENLIYYKRIRTQRNNLLQQISRAEAGENELDFWDKELAKQGESIIKKRREVIEYFNIGLEHFYQEISGKINDHLNVEYDCNFEGGLLEKLQNNHSREIAYGNTIFGPHRDDMIFKLNNFNMANFASRGEIKTAIMALKIAELKYLEKSLNDLVSDHEKKSPIILLDDIFSEFDAARRSHLSKLIAGYQTLITSTEEEHLSPDLLEKAKVVNLATLL